MLSAHIINAVNQQYGAAFKPDYIADPTSDQIANAIMNYAQNCDPYKITAFTDSTISRDGSKGMIFTDEGVYIAELDFLVDADKLTPLPVRYDDITDLSFDGTKAIFTHADNSVTEGYLGIYGDWFGECFTAIQNAMLSSDSTDDAAELSSDVKETFSLPLKDGGTKVLEVLCRVEYNGTEYILTFWEDVDQSTYLFFEASEGQYIMLTDDELIDELSFKFYNASPEFKEFCDSLGQADDTEDEEIISGNASDDDITVSNVSEDNILTMRDENGNLVRLEFLDLIEYHGNDYVVLYDTDPDAPDEVIICKVHTDENDVESFLHVEDDIATVVFEIFKSRHYEADPANEAEELAPYNGDKPFIFVSYSHKDSETVMHIVHKLQEDGYHVWYDEGIKPGSEWDEDIAQHVETCSLFVAFMSRNYLDSDNCKDEINYARDMVQNRLLIYIDDVKLTGGMAMRLNRLQAMFFHNYPLKAVFYRKLYESDIMNIDGLRNN